MEPPNIAAMTPNEMRVVCTTSNNLLKLEDHLNRFYQIGSRSLKEQINSQNKPVVNPAFKIHIETISRADIEKVALLILQKKKHLENARDMDVIEKPYTMLDALEWLQIQS